MTDHDPTDGTRHGPNTPTYPDVIVRLTGEDANIYSIIGRVAKALRRQVGDEVATAFIDAATSCDSYDDVLGLVMRTVEID
jgi:hypothetical protein